MRAVLRDPLFENLIGPGLARPFGKEGKHWRAPDMTPPPRVGTPEPRLRSVGPWPLRGPGPAGLCAADCATAKRHLWLRKLALRRRRGAFPPRAPPRRHSLCRPGATVPGIMAVPPQTLGRRGEAPCAGTGGCWFSSPALDCARFRRRGAARNGRSGGPNRAAPPPGSFPGRGRWRSLHRRKLRGRQSIRVPRVENAMTPWLKISVGLDSPAPPGKQ